MKKNMSSMEIKEALLKTLEDLSKDNFKLFCNELVNREEEPRVRRSRVEGKCHLDIVDVLVSTFTEAGAVGVAMETLNEIDCNQQAEALARETGGGQ